METVQTANQDSSAKKAFYNIQVDVVAREELFSRLRSVNTDAGHQEGQITINFLNAHCFNVAQRNPDYRAALNSTTLLLNDGIGVDIGAWLLGFKFAENMNGTDLIPEIVGICAESGLPVYFLGGREIVIERAVEELRNRYPELSVAGFSSGYFRDSAMLLQNIRQSGARVLVVGMGVPLQELWVNQYKSELPGVTLFVAGGAIFDFLSGAVKRAPDWVQRMRLEWLFRLLQEPKRLFSRYVLGNFVYIFTIFYKKFITG